MLSNRVALALIGGACVLAAGAGGFLASRYAGAPEPPAAVASASTDQTSTAAVEETEAVVDVGGAQPAAALVPDKTAVAPPVEPPPVTDATPTARKAPVETAVKTRTARRAEPRQELPARPEPPSRHERVEREAPVVSAPAQSSAPVPAEPTPDPATEVPLPRIEPVEIPRAPERRLEELVVPTDSVIGLQLERTISSETARVEDRVDARVTRDVRVNGRVAIPAGSRARGEVTAVERGGKVKERARLGVRFHTLVLADGTTLPLQTDTVVREGESPAASSSAKIGGGAIGGAIIGAILGGGKGAIIGGSTGAAGGTAAVMAGSRRAATMPAGSTVTVRVLAPVPVTVEQ